MKKKLTIILSLGCTALLCAGFAACSEGTELDKLRKQGYTVTVTYNPNGGAVSGSDKITYVDMFKPTDYPKNEETGEYEIKLMEPEDSRRPTENGDPITFTKIGYFYAGWYATRNVVKNAAGKPVDETGRELTETEIDGETVYYYEEIDEEKNTSSKIITSPAYTYEDYWDFETDVISCTEKGTEITLYAAWVPYYEFNYYYKEGNDWALYGTTKFDYKAANAENSQTADKDTIWTPQWQDGAVSYTFQYSDKSKFNFPQKDGTTFSKAYTSSALTPETEIAGAFEHTGTLDLAYGENKALRVNNRVQNIYVELLEGERYKISSVEQLLKTDNSGTSVNVNLDGWYEILADLDFTEKTWPAAFSTGEFRGKMFASEGQSYTLKNISVKHTTATTGGVFGTIAKDAEISNLNFENVTFDLASVSTRQYTAFGLFAGKIDDNAKLKNVTVGGLFKIGEISLSSDYDVNLLANGNTVGITVTEIKLQVYAKVVLGNYYYNVNPTTIEVDETGQITMTFETAYKGEQASYDIQINKQEE